MIRVSELAREEACKRVICLRLRWGLHWGCEIVVSIEQWGVRSRNIRTCLFYTPSFLPKGSLTPMQK